MLRDTVRCWMALALVAGLGAGCGKKAAPATATAATDGGVALPEAATSTTAGAADQPKLAKAAADVRCQLTGGALVDAGLYQRHGFASASAFAAAWQVAADADPAWATKTLAALYARPCPGAAPAKAAADAPTPTQAANPATPGDL